MIEPYTELQVAFTKSADEADDYRAQCRSIVLDLSEDLANYLHLPPSEIKFVDAEVLDESADKGVIEVPQQHNDPFDAGELVDGGWYRIGLCFGIAEVGKTRPAWYPIIPLRLKLNSKTNEFTLQIENPKQEFELGQSPKVNIRRVSEWIVQHLVKSSQTIFTNYLSGNSRRVMGFNAGF